MARRATAGPAAARPASAHPDGTYRAVSDATRREILDLLAARGPLRAGDIAVHFGRISRPAVSRHLRVLQDAELLRGETRGREHWLSINPLPLREVQGWVAHYEHFWRGKLDELARLVEDGPAEDQDDAPSGSRGS